MAAVVHLMSNNLYGGTEPHGLSTLQKQHINWVANRNTDAKETLLATLPQQMGGDSESGPQCQQQQHCTDQPRAESDRT